MLSGRFFLDNDETNEALGVADLEARVWVPGYVAPVESGVAVA